MSNEETFKTEDKVRSARPVGGMMGAGQRRGQEKTSKPFVAEGDGEKLFEKPKETGSNSASTPERLRVSVPSPALPGQDGEPYYAEVPVGKIRSWRFKDRTSAEIEDDPEFLDLMGRVRGNGVVQAIGVRKLEEPDGDIEYEEIFGFKRLTASKLLGLKTIPAKVFVTLTDEQAAVLQHEENTGKSDPSYYSRGCAYLRYLDAEMASGPYALAALLGEDKQSMANYVRVAREMREEFKEHLKLHTFSSKVLFNLISLTRDGGGVSPETMVKKILDHKQKLNESPQQASRVLIRLESEVKPARKEPSNTKVLEVDGREAFSWKRNKRGATINVSADIAKKLDDDLIEQVLTDLANRL